MDDLEIRQQIAALVAGETTAHELEDALESAAWDDQHLALITRQLAHDALRLLNEHDAGDWSNEELAERLGIVSRTYWFRQAPKVVLSGASVSVMTGDQAWSAPDKRREVVSA